MKGKSYLSLGGVSMGIAGSIVDHNFFESWLGMKVQAVDMTELRRRIDQKIYDEAELEMALAWADKNFRYGEDENNKQYQRNAEQSRAVLRESLLMAMCIRDMMQGNSKLADIGRVEESLGYNAIAAGFQGQRHWTDQYPNGDTAEAILNSSFDWNGALVDKQGNLLYPIISWKCPRTAAVMDNIERLISAQQLQAISGVGAFSFNTLYKLVWLKENHPQLLERAHAWLFISSLINHRLTGEFTTDITMAGTSQMLDIQQRDFSPQILQATGIPRRLFPRLVEAGEQIGTLQNSAAAMLGLPVGIPVISAGHDTQFALFGAGAEQNEPVLSSGTWEILMVRSAQVDTSLLSQYAGSTCELDSQAGLYNPGMQWLASGVLEWVRKLFWTAETPWQILIEEARLIAPGADGVKMQCDLLSCQNAGWQGVTLNTTRGHFYRAALEGLTTQLQRNLQMLEKIGHFKASELLLVGGGSRNTLWNQIKANMLDIPVKVLDDAETTVAGAALFGWYGVGEFNSPEEARAQIHYQYRYFYPQTEPEFIEEV
ncbi:TPA: L-fuculokinase [Escherichia coli]